MGGQREPTNTEVEGMTETNAESLGEIEALLSERRTFPPPEDFRAGALIREDSVYEEAERDPEAFWMRLAERIRRLVARRPPRGSSGTHHTAPGSPTAS